MATISKFYLLDAATPNTGTMPGAGDAFAFSGDSSGHETNARTARDATDVTGSSNPDIDVTVTYVANQLQQNWGFRRYVSRPLAARTFAAADGNWTFSAAGLQSNTSHQQILKASIYAWRPGSGAVVDSSGVIIACARNSTTTAETAVSATNVWGTSTTILAGDILVFEVWDGAIQAMSTAYTSSYSYDGTTEASTTTCASFVTPPSALTLFTASAVLLPFPHQSVPFYPRPSRPA